MLTRGREKDREVPSVFDHASVGSRVDPSRIGVFGHDQTPRSKVAAAIDFLDPRNGEFEQIGVISMQDDFLAGRRVLFHANDLLRLLYALPDDLDQIEG